MSIVKKVVKFAEEKSLNKLRKMRRAKERNAKYAETGDKVYEQEPQVETPKEVEESFAHYKRCCDPKDPLYQRHPSPTELIKTEVRGWAPFVPLKVEDYTMTDEQRRELDEEILKPSVHYKGGSEGWESDGDDWFD